jgi:hypothetical protein
MKNKYSQPTYDHRASAINVSIVQEARDRPRASSTVHIYVKTTKAWILLIDSTS